MVKAETPYSEGDVFVVPLLGEKMAVGLVVRMSGDGSVFGYFFDIGVKNENEITDKKLAELAPKSAVLTCMFGDHALYKKKWKVLRKFPNWDADEWRLPRFYRIIDSESMGYVSEYSDTLKFIGEKKVNVESIKKLNLPKDSQLGSGVVEARLSKLLN